MKAYRPRVRCRGGSWWRRRAIPGHSRARCGRAHKIRCGRARRTPGARPVESARGVGWTAGVRCPPAVNRRPGVNWEEINMRRRFAFMAAMGLSLSLLPIAGVAVLAKTPTGCSTAEGLVFNPNPVVTSGDLSLTDQDDADYP